MPADKEVLAGEGQLNEPPLEEKVHEEKKMLKQKQKLKG